MDFLEAIAAYAWIIWIVLIAVFLVIEMLTLDFTFLMLALGGLAGLLADLLGAPLWLQFIIAALAAGLAILLLRPPLVRRLQRSSDPTPSNVDALLGRSGVVTLPVTAQAGQVKLNNGDTWTARPVYGGQLPTGTPVRVVRIEGATAFIEPEENPL